MYSFLICTWFRTGLELVLSAVKLFPRKSVIHFSSTNCKQLIRPDRNSVGICVEGAELVKELFLQV